MKLTNISSKLAIRYIDSNGYECWATKEIAGDLTPNEDPQQAYKELDNIVLHAHSNSIGNGLVIQQNTRKHSLEEPLYPDVNVISAMDKCTTPDELKTYGTYMKLTEKEQEFYNNKLKQLSNG